MNRVGQTDLLVLLATLGAGLGGVALLARQSGRHATPFLTSMVHTVLAHNLLVVVGLGLRYVELHLLEGSTPAASMRIVLACLLGLAILKLLFVRAFLTMSGQFFVRAPFRDPPGRYWTISGVALAVLVAGSTAEIVWGWRGAQGLFLIFEVLMLAAILAGAARHVRASLELQRPSRRSAGILLGGLHLVIFLPALAMVVALSSGWVNADWTGLVNSCWLLGYNVLMVLWARRYVPDLFAARVGDGRAGDLFERYGITGREREIIGLICEGRSNQEIADAIFVALQTVKDHNHNIFRKTGVRSRVQLVNLFGDALRSAGDG